MKTESEHEKKIREISEQKNPYAKECPNRHLWSEGYRSGNYASQFNPQQEVVSDEMIQGSEDMIAERLHGELTINDEEIINEHPHLVKNIKDAMRSYSELCQKELIKKLSSPKTSEAEAIEFAEWIKSETNIGNIDIVICDTKKPYNQNIAGILRWIFLKIKIAG